MLSNIILNAKRVCNMLSVPKNGWVNISLNDWEDRASYLTDVHLDILDSLICFLKKRKSLVVYCDAEGWEYYIIFDWFSTYILTLKDTTDVTIIDKCIEDIAKEVYEDISKNIDAWSMWDLDTDEKIIKKNKDRISRKLKVLKSLIDKFEEKGSKNI